MSVRDVEHLYRISSALKAPQRVHIALKPYEGKELTFIVNGDLTQHQKIQVYQESYACMEGGQAFVWKIYWTSELILARLTVKNIRGF